MATFYGTVKGNSGAASRTGSYASGMRASVQSWKGSIIVEMDQTNKEDEPVIAIFINEGSSDRSGADNCIFEGTIDQLKRRLSNNG